MKEQERTIITLYFEEFEAIIKYRNIFLKHGKINFEFKYTGYRK